LTWHHNSDDSNIIILSRQDSIFSTATCCRLEGLEFKHWLGWDYPYLSTPTLGTTQPHGQGVMCLLPRSKAAGAWRKVSTTHPHLASWSKKELSYTSTPLRAFMACYRANFTFYLLIWPWYSHQDLTCHIMKPVHKNKRERENEYKTLAHLNSQ